MSWFSRSEMARRQSLPREPQDDNLHIVFKPVAEKFLRAIVHGPISEIGCFGARGDRKTCTFLAATLEHAKVHAAAGFPLPVHWMGVADTFESHKAKTHLTMMEPLWKNAWRFEDGGHIAIARIDETPMVRISLFGLEDQAALEKVRRAAHGLWFEEPAPAGVFEHSGGLDERAWRIATTSCRMPSHFNPKVFTSNLPDEDHWTWRLFVGPHLQALCEPPHCIDYNGRRCFRLPPGEGASAEYRAQGIEALKDRPDLLKRLFSALPGSVLLGQPVAQGFSFEDHVATEPIYPVAGKDLFMGFDFGHQPSCIIAQEERGTARVFASLVEPGAGVKQLLEGQVQPWLARNAPWVLGNTSSLLIGYDPAGEVGGQDDIQKSPLLTIQQMLGYPDCVAGPVPWTVRNHILRSAFERRRGVLLDPTGCELLIKALNGRWYYPMDRSENARSLQPKKPNPPWCDLGDAFIYMLARMGYDAFDYQVGQETKVETNLTYN